MKLLTVAAGSHDDVAPFAGLGQALRAVGHSVTVAAYETFVGLIGPCGLQFGALPGDPRLLEAAAWERGNTGPLGTARLLKLTAGHRATYMRRSWPQHANAPTSCCSRGSAHSDARTALAEATVTSRRPRPSSPAPNLEDSRVTTGPFEMTQRVRPRHCDAQGMVHAGRYHEFCEDAFLGWLEHVGLSYADLRALGVDLIISDARYSHRRPARFDDELLIAVTGETMAESALSAHFEIRRGDDLLASASISYVAVQRGRRCPVPDELRRLIPSRPQAAPNAEALLDALHNAQAALYGDGEPAAVRQLLDPEIVWRIPGHNQIAGTYRGVEEVIAYMLRRRELANATFRMHRREVLAGPSHFAALTDGAAERHGVRYTWSTVGLYRAREGRILECVLIPLDQEAFDAAWR